MQLHIYMLLFVTKTVQEVVRNSLEHWSSPGPDQVHQIFPIPESQTGSIVTGASDIVTPQGQREGEGTGWVWTHPSLRREGGSGPESGAGPPIHGRGLPQPLSPQQRLNTAGQAPRKPPSFPQEEPDNGADTSGADRVTEGRDPARENARTHSHTQHMLNSHTQSHTSNTHSHTQSTHTQTDRVFNYPATPTLTEEDTNTATPLHSGTETVTSTHTSQGSNATSSISAWPHPQSFSQPSFFKTSSLPAKPGEKGLTLTPQMGHVAGKMEQSQGLAWRTPRSTDQLHPNLTPAVTSRSAMSHTKLEEVLRGNFISNRTSTMSLIETLGRTNRSPSTQSSGQDGSAVFSKAGITNQMDLTIPLESDITSRTAGLDSFDRHENQKSVGTIFTSTSPSTTHSLHTHSQHLDSFPSQTLDTYTPTSIKGADLQRLNRLNPYTHKATQSLSDTHAGTHTRMPPIHPSKALLLPLQSTAYPLTPPDFPVSPSLPPVLNADRDIDGTTSSKNTLSFPATTTVLTLGGVVQVIDTSTSSAGLLSSDMTMTTTTGDDSKKQEPDQATGTSTNSDSHTLPSSNKLLSKVLHTSTSLPSYSRVTTLAETGSNTDTSRDTNRHVYIPKTHTTLSYKSLTSLSLASSTNAQSNTPIPKQEATLPPSGSQASTPSSERTALPTQPSLVHTSHTAIPLPSSTHTPVPDHTTTSHTQYVPTTTDQSGQISWGPTTPSDTARATRTSPEPPVYRTGLYPGRISPVGGTASASSSSLDWTSTTAKTPKIFIVPDRPPTIKVDSIELLLQIVLQEPISTFSIGMEEDTALVVEPFLLKAPGFSRILETWSSGRAVQSLVKFNTKGAVAWLGVTGAGSLLERTGLAQVVLEGRRFLGSKVTNITVGGLQGDVCAWLLQCQEGYECVSHAGTANHSCTSSCHSDFCHHHGICTHHPDQLPVCRCLVGEDFWFMGRRCDVKMTRARLVGACLAVLVIMVMLIGVVALLTVRRYRAMLIQAKVDQTRSRY